MNQRSRCASEARAGRLPPALGTLLCLSLLCAGCAAPEDAGRHRRGAPSDSPLPDLGGAVTMLQTATFNFTCSDEQGHPLVRGQFTLPWPIAEGQVVRGSWESRYVGPVSTTNPGEERNAVGPQVGRGTLTAERDGDEVRLNLNPQMNDNNVTLVGTVAGEALRGRWDYSTFVGTTAGGGFEAQKQEAHR